MKTPDEKLYTAKELAERWKLKIMTLANWRSQGKGPAYIKLTERKLLYRHSDVIAFESASVRQTEKRS